MPSLPPRHRPPGVPDYKEREKRRKAFLDTQRPNSVDRGYDAAWKKCRALFVKVHPVCSVPGCGKQTSDVDHVQSVRDRPDLRLSWSNLRPFCHPHHSARTAKDQGFARVVF